MHQCEEFRERITEHIIDREDITKKPELRRELIMCPSCSEFYAESREMMEALSGVDLSVSESQWWGIERRLQATLLHEQRASEFQGRRRTSVFQSFSSLLKFAATPFFAGAAALLVITVGLSRLTIPVGALEVPAQPLQAFFVEHSVPLDPVTVDFLEESELLLRNVMKMEPHDVDDLADAKKVANEQLAELAQRKEAAAEVPPVVSVMETYETVLRDIRNVDERSAGEDISDIQRRIQSNALIPTMKTFQPRLTEVSFSLR